VQDAVPQVTLYIDEDTDAKARAAAAAAGQSYSRWVVELIRARTRDEWPLAVRELAGSYQAFPMREEAGSATDIERVPVK
jgi:hypothetical protein